MGDSEIHLLELIIEQPGILGHLDQHNQSLEDFENCGFAYLVVIIST